MLFYIFNLRTIGASPVTTGTDVWRRVNELISSSSETYDKYYTISVGVVY